MSEKHCLKNSEKKYIIPTDKWLKPIEPLITSISTRGKLILANMVKKEKVVVKITKNSNLAKIKNLNYAVRRLPNFPKVYCVFECKENESNFDTNYLDVYGFCKPNPNDSDFIIILEIMKRYNNKLSELLNALELENTKNIMKQLIFALMYAFESKGFIHGDLHIENILINKYDEQKELIYIINKKKYNITTQIEYIIMDFDKSISYDTTFMNLPEFDENKTLIYSIIKVINICGKLLTKINKYDTDQINTTLDKVLPKIHYDVIGQNISVLASFYINSRSYNEFIELTIQDTIYFLNIFWKKLYNEYLFPTHSIQAFINK